MAKFILGRKLNMTQKFTEDGNVQAVTVVEAGPCTVVQVKDEADGYQAVQLGYGQTRKINKPLAGHLKGLNNFRYLKEFRVNNTEIFTRGKVIDVSSFIVGDILKVTAVSKGKGFQGVVKRHGFHGAPASHGHKDQLRMPGSIGATDSARVFKGTRMGGRMGGNTVTVDNLKVIEVDTEKNLIYIQGAVPGARNALVQIVADGDIKFVEIVKEEPKLTVEKPASKEQKAEVVEKTEEKEAPKEEKKVKPEEPSAEVQAEEEKQEDKK